jgi:hypothetical protein
VGGKRGVNALPFAVLLRFVAIYGRFSKGHGEIPVEDLVMFGGVGQIDLVCSPTQRGVVGGLVGWCRGRG